MMSALTRAKSVRMIAAGSMMAFAGILTAGPLTPPGPPAETTKTLNEIEPRMVIDKLPFSIEASGSYYLTSDLIGSSGKDGIVVTADNATIDLNGFNLMGSGNGVDNVGIRVQTIQSAREAARYVIKNGGIFNWPGGGVRFESGSTSVNGDLHHLKIAGNGGDGVSLGGGRIEDCVIRGNGGNGLSFFDVFTELTVANSRIIGNMGNGIEVMGAPPSGGAAGLSLIDTIIAGHSINGILIGLLLPAVQGVRARVVSNTGHGLALAVPPSTVPAPRGPMALLLPAVQLTDSSFSHNGGNGIFVHQTPNGVWDDTDIVHVLLNGNGGDGLRVDYGSGVGTGGNVHVGGSKLNGNTGDGMSVLGGSGRDTVIGAERSEFMSNGAAGLSVDLVGNASADIYIDDIIIGLNVGSGAIVKMGEGMSSKFIFGDGSVSRNQGHGVHVDLASTGDHVVTFTGLELTQNLMTGSQVQVADTVENFSLNFEEIKVTYNQGVGLDLLVAGTGPRVAKYTGLEIVGNQGAGAQINVGTGAAIALNFEEIKVTYNVGAGLKVMGAGTATGVITHSVATNNTAEGIHLATGSGFRVADNHTTANAAGLRVDSAPNTIIRNTSGGNHGMPNPNNYLIGSGNDVGPTGPASQATSPFANIEF